jgi:anti-sigma regulatory factor (Ser/Thr protein kinase)
VAGAREELVSCDLRRELAEVRRAREEARKALAGWGLTDMADDVELIVGELAANALRHGEGPVRLRIFTDGSHLNVEVHDDGAGRPVRRPVTADDESGRGLELIDGLLKLTGGKRTVTSDAAGNGKTVHVAISLAVG